MTQEEFVAMLRETHKKALLTKREVCKEINIGTTSLDKLRQAGKIKSRKVLGQIMFDIGEVARFMADA